MIDQSLKYIFNDAFAELMKMCNGRDFDEDVVRSTLDILKSLFPDKQEKMNQLLREEKGIQPKHSSECEEPNCHRILKQKRIDLGFKKCCYCQDRRFRLMKSTAA